MTSQTPDYLFPPDSAIWMINRERALLLGGTRALLMQLAHPMVAESVYHHSYVFTKPVLRLRRTLNLTLALVYGTTQEVRAAVAEIERAHRPAVGRLSDAVGSHAAGAVYNPRNPRQALWVQATLVEGSLHGYETFIAPLSDAVKDAFYQDTKTIGEMMGIKRAMLPAHYDGLLDFMQTAVASGEVHVSAKAREIAPFLLARTLPIIKYAAYPTYRLTVGILPAEIRVQYGYTWTEHEGKLLAAFCRLTRATVRQLPPILRYMGMYQRAMRSESVQMYFSQ
jgi:uncharacterized protein (DUF2236 family)